MNKRKRPADNDQQCGNDLAEPLLDADTHRNDHETSDMHGDRANIAILFFLYLLQGIPLGLTAAIPMLLQNRGASYKQQAEFSFATWPFSIKLLWAPIVDSLFWARFGRRKSWLIPTQYLIGLFMLILSVYVDHWLGDDSATPNIPVLTVVFFAMNFFAATQDIAVDGWALTMLKRRNVGHASTCNSVGQTAGYFFGYVVFIALESKDFCNSYLRSAPEEDGLVTLPSFLWFWGVCFMITTTFIAIMKREGNQRIHDKVDEIADKELELGIRETYQLLWKIINMRSIQVLASILLTVKFTFAACDSVTSLKLIEAGLPKEKLALLAVPMVPLQIFLPLVISKYTNGPQPMEIYLKALPLRIVFGIFAGVIVAIAPYTLSANGEVPVYLYGILLLNYAVYQIFLYCMFVAVMAFFAKISDPSVGGTYMTLLNTICNLGGNWPTSLVLWMVDILTWKKCIYSNIDANNTIIHSASSCNSKQDEEACGNNGGKCETSIDGYYVESIICLLYGLLWLKWGTTRIRALQALPLNVWRITKSERSTR